MTRDSYFHKSRAGVAGAPLFVLLHGTGGDENQFFDFGSRLLPEATILSPVGDVSEHGAARFFRRTGEGVYDMADLQQATVKMADFIDGQIEEGLKTPGAEDVTARYRGGPRKVSLIMLRSKELEQRQLSPATIDTFGYGYDVVDGGRCKLSVTGRCIRDGLADFDIGDVR